MEILFLKVHQIIIMTANSNKAIFLQMADRIADGILSGQYHADERIPSVREYAVTLGVNVNTAVKAYEELARSGIIYNRRGLGYFVHADARDRIRNRRRQEFFRDMLPEVVRQMRLLGISKEDITNHITTLLDNASDEDPAGFGQTFFEPKHD